jgi:Sulfotransferase family
VTRLERLPRSPWRVAKDGLHALQDSIARAYGRPGRGMLTDLRQDGRPVIYLHNPKTGGTSLGTFLGVARRSHAFPVDRLSPRHWLGSFAIVAVRDPFDRFLSGYFDHVRKPQTNALTRMYGPRIKAIDPFDYLDVLLANPKFGGSQLNWTDYPLSAKPRADLVLRYEDIAIWPERLAAAGLDLGARVLPYRNRGPRPETDILQALGLTQDDFARLEQVVRHAFRADALALGYPLPDAGSPAAPQRRHGGG